MLKTKPSLNTSFHGFCRYVELKKRNKMFVNAVCNIAYLVDWVIGLRIIRMIHSIPHSMYLTDISCLFVLVRIDLLLQHSGWG